MLQRGTAPKPTATEQPLKDDRMARPANSGIAETLTPFWMRASVTLKSGASNVSWAYTLTVAATVPQAIAAMSFMVER